MSVVQLAIGFFRPKLDAPQRTPWFMLHGWWGRLALLLGWVNIFLGVVLMHDLKVGAGWGSPCAATKGCTCMHAQGLMRLPAWLASGAACHKPAARLADRRPVINLAAGPVAGGVAHRGSGAHWLLHGRPLGAGDPQIQGQVTIMPSRVHSRGKQGVCLRIIYSIVLNLVSRAGGKGVGR